MANAILIAYIVCFSMGLIPSIKLIYRDVKPYTIVERNGTSRAARCKERFVAVVFDVAQTLLLVNDITAVTMAIVSTSQFKWIDLSITCTLQLLAGMNVGITAYISRTANHGFNSLSAISVACLRTVLLRLCHTWRSLSWPRGMLSAILLIPSRETSPALSPGVQKQRHYLYTS
jgi:hypothetical protein